MKSLMAIWLRMMCVCVCVCVCVCGGNGMCQGGCVAFGGRHILCSINFKFNHIYFPLVLPPSLP